MKRATTTLSLLVAMSVSLAGCFDDDNDPPAGNSEGMTGSTGSTTDVADGTATDEGPMTTVTPPETTDADSSTGPDPTDTEGNEFQFDDSPPEDYAQVDRMGMPAINTAVISDKDLYNQSSPSDDASGTFVEQIVANLTGLHGALDDDLVGAGLVACDVDTCVGQAAPLVVPDTLKIDLMGTAGFPNGRTPTDPVMDVTLAVVLLDLSVPGQTPVSLVGLNPTENDVSFGDDFPYFAEAH